jgi:hypothetical protein
MNQRNADVPESTGRFAYEGLERLIHEKARLSILTSLAAHPKGLLFSDLKEYHRTRPQTLCRLTDEGRRRFLEYIAVLEEVVADAVAAKPAAAGGLEKGLSPA